MVSPELSAYVANTRAAGYSDEIIRQQLLGSGYSEQLCNEALQATHPNPHSGPSPAPLAPTEPTWVERFWVWLKQDFLVKLGAFFMLLALSWFVSYGINEGFISPVMQVVLGLAVGVGFLAVGVWRVETHRHQGGIFLALGSVATYLTIWAACDFHKLFPPAVGLAVMFLVAVFIAFVAVRYRSRSLVGVGFGLAGIAPFLTGSEEPSLVILYSYALVITLGTIWVQRWIGQTVLPVAVFILVTIYGLVVVDTMSNAEHNLALLFSFVFAVVFFVSNIVSVLARGDNRARVIQALVAAGTGLYLFGWIEYSAVEQWQGLLFIAWSVLSVTGGYLTFAFFKNRAAFYLYGALGLSLAVMATFSELDGSRFITALCFEIMALIAFASIYANNYRLVTRLSWLFVIPAFFSLEYLYSEAWDDGFLHPDCLALVSLVLCSVVSGLCIIRLRAHNIKMVTDAATTLLVVAAFYTVCLIWLISHASGLTDEAATTISIFIYTTSGIAAIIYGRHAALAQAGASKINHAAVKWCGYILIGFVTVYLLVSMIEMETIHRIITFGIVATLLLATGFINLKAFAKK